MAKYIKRTDAMRIVDELHGPRQAYHRIKNLPAADVVPAVHGPLRVEITTDDFVNKELAQNGGWYRKHYFCPACNQKLKEETYAKEHCFASWDLVREECPLHYCPNCGAKLDT